MTTILTALANALVKHIENNPSSLDEIVTNGLSLIGAYLKNQAATVAAPKV